MLWDQAGFHTGNDVEVPGSITVVPLPAYSPELNPMENLWHYLRSHHWANRAYEDYAALLDAAEQAWRASACNPAIIQSVCNPAIIQSVCNPAIIQSVCNAPYALAH